MRRPGDASPATAATAGDAPIRIARHTSASHGARDRPTNGVVLSVDEKTQIQALERTQPLLPLRPHVPAGQTHDYRRNGLTSLHAALEVTHRSLVAQPDR